MKTNSLIHDRDDFHRTRPGTICRTSPCLTPGLKSAKSHCTCGWSDHSHSTSLLGCFLALDELPWNRTRANIRMSSVPCRSTTSYLCTIGGKRLREGSSWILFVMFFLAVTIPCGPSCLIKPKFLIRYVRSISASHISCRLTAFMDMPEQSLWAHYCSQRQSNDMKNTVRPPLTLYRALTSTRYFEV